MRKAPLALCGLIVSVGALLSGMLYGQGGGQQPTKLCESGGGTFCRAPDTSTCNGITVFCVHCTAAGQRAGCTGATGICNIQDDTSGCGQYETGQCLGGTPGCGNYGPAYVDCPSKSCTTPP